MSQLFKHPRLLILLRPGRKIAKLGLKATPLIQVATIHGVGQATAYMKSMTPLKVDAQHVIQPAMVATSVETNIAMPAHLATTLMAQNVHKTLNQILSHLPLKARKQRKHQHPKMQVRPHKLIGQQPTQQVSPIRALVVAAGPILLLMLLLSTTRSTTTCRHQSQECKSKTVTMQVTNAMEALNTKFSTILLKMVQFMNKITLTLHLHKHVVKMNIKTKITSLKAASRLSSAKIGTGIAKEGQQNT